MPGERFLTIQLHELLMYLGNRGVATVLVGAHQGLIGNAMHTPIDASYLADAVILLRYFEQRRSPSGAVDMKKRGSEHADDSRVSHEGGRLSWANHCEISEACSRELLFMNLIAGNATSEK